MPKDSVLSIVIPVYNEELLIATTLKKIVQQVVNGWKKEVIIVDDGSTDRTAAVIRKTIEDLHAKDVKFSLFVQKENQGKGEALKKGFLHTTGDIVLIQDADCEYSPKDYGILLEPFTHFHADVVYGSRLMSHRPRRVLYYWHYQVNTLLTMLSNVCTGLNLTDMETGYKVFRGDLIRSLASGLVSKRFGFEPEITAKISRIKKLRIFEVGISYEGRTYEEGKKIGWKDGLLALWEIIRFNFIER